ncbi:MAG TPA: hypothetical protein VNW97_06815 [Candidatus Saccharimonadales bacterium]|nr:hypothetical protein [Candidatus Saccharimonadales bacterium]
MVFTLCITLNGQQTAPSDVAKVNQQQARAILDQMVQALGGDAYMNVHDVKTEVRYGSFYHGNVNSTTIYRRYWQWPDKDRLEFSVGRNISVYFWQWPFKDQAKDATLIFLHNGDQGYERTYRGTKFEDPEQLRRFLLSRDYSLGMVLRQWLKDPGVALFYDGPTISENRNADKITVLNGHNQAVTLLIAADTHLPIKKVYTVRNPVYRDHDQEVEVYDNWKVVQGITTPYNTLITHNGEMVSQQYVLAVSYNNRLEPSLFDPGPVNYDRKK